MGYLDFCLRRGTLPGIFSLIAVFLTFGFTFDCSFFYFEGNNDEAAEGFLYGYGFYKQGLYNPSVSYLSCSKYAQGQWGSFADGASKFGRGMATLAVILAIPAFFSVLYPWCIPVACKSCTNFVGAFCLTQTILCAMSLSFLSSSQCHNNPNYQSGCQLGRGAFMCISALVFWFAASILCFLMPQVSKEEVALYNTKGKGNVVGGIGACNVDPPVDIVDPEKAVHKGVST